MFSLDEEQEKRFQEWDKEHKKTCKLCETPFSAGAIGGRLSYCFIPTGLGIIIKIRCACKENDWELDVTDYECW